MVAIFLAFLAVTAIILFTILLLFLPAIKELIERTDAGPRAIIDSSTEKNLIISRL